ncbi:hypothetical protein BBM86_22705 [Vibrio parahaemolyticus]|nr:hypothetical protein ACS91_02525 [Vibrio parahaemolyticus]OEB77173.1 hypothetical protein BBM86_22705 [Vibrio parahaemolyticus]TON17165.1 hypothetical protein CGH61_21850 [Vibrio parahaemolyticus]
MEKNLKWFDSSKGIFDYVLASIPLFSLLFVVIAYFHTVHPRFEQHDELERTKKTLYLETLKVGELTEEVNSLQSSISKIGSQKNYVEQLYLSLAEPRARLEYLTNSDKLYFSKSEIVSEYRKYSEQIVSEAGSTADPLSIKAFEVAVSQSKNPDLLVVDEWACGTAGCLGPLFISKNDAYCFSTWAHTQTIDNLEELVSLECNVFSDTNRRFLSDVVDK